MCAFEMLAFWFHLAAFGEVPAADEPAPWVDEPNEKEDAGRVDFGVFFGAALPDEHLVWSSVTEGETFEPSVADEGFDCGGG